MSVPGKAKVIKLDNPSQVKTNHQSETKQYRLEGNKTSEALPKGCFLEIA
jgi:hypothetical protein